MCSAGTYVRTLAEDLGKGLGVGAHLVELRRTRAGHFTINDAITLDGLAELAASGSVESKVISPDAILAHLPAIELTAEELTNTIHGVDVKVDRSRVTNCENGAAVRMRSPDNQLIAMGTFDESRRVVHPRVVIANN